MLHDVDMKARLRNIQKELVETDGVLVRYVEDLVEVLVRKKILDLEDIPQEVKKKIIHRRSLRSERIDLIEKLNTPKGDTNDK